MNHIVVLGAGMVGRAMAIDLAKEFHVTSVDISDDNLSFLKNIPNITCERRDLSNTLQISRSIQSADLVIGAVPGFMGYETLKSVILEGKNVVDISFFNEDPFSLDTLAKENDVTAVIDCGVAPGLSNIILGYESTKSDVTSFSCMVGGLPKQRVWPFEYKAPFSPIDVIEEYIRPARLVEYGKIVTKPALSECEKVTILPVGTLEAFNTDGLRTLLKTMSIPHMKEKTLRYPKHIEYIQMLKATGFFDEREISVNEMSVRPIDVASKLLISQWMLDPNDKEFTVMTIDCNGIQNNTSLSINYHLFDEYDVATHTSSMARTTGYTCTCVSRLILSGMFTQKGLIPPEYIGMKNDCFQELLKLLEERSVTLTRSVASHNS